MKECKITSAKTLVFIDKRLWDIYNGEHRKNNTLTRRVNCGTFQREAHMLEVPYRETVEDYL